MRVTALGTGGLIVSLPVTEVDPSAALIVAVFEAATASVETVNVAELCPARTVTLEGGMTEALLEVKITTTPAEGAGPDRVTVPVDGVPPVTAAGENIRLVGTGDVIVRVAETVADAREPVIVARV